MHPKGLGVRIVAIHPGIEIGGWPFLTEGTFSVCPPKNFRYCKIAALVFVQHEPLSARTYQPGVGAFANGLAALSIRSQRLELASNRDAATAPILSALSSFEGLSVMK